jgi:hypothetical protein
MKESAFSYQLILNFNGDEIINLNNQTYQETASLLIHPNQIL